ncbi:MAG: hypothetical protein KBS82_05065 [Oscillospiraceae bacterium]|nr:hypothetical protein [Candidatus Limimonas egerieequi]
MTLIEINDICVAKMSEALVEVEVPDEFWHEVYEITKDVMEKNIPYYDEYWQRSSLPEDSTNDSFLVQHDGDKTIIRNL